ncbi:hypothetical protein AAC387_Pa01g3529 [Persea americana]|eukprot:TRINITY_DN18604_c0_g1_i1.p1 TRINITY_DN18604_c0_g1~~TRINITY_DN18604_c0_g1_i1.p1  ORF type:complete len:210 (+),score=34.67 TRINITY_DN18604_c0_g1_i1:584-1213(+)
MDITGRMYVGGVNTLLFHWAFHIGYANTVSVNKTLERYRRCCYNPHDANITDGETQSWYQELSKLKSKYESLQRSQRHLLGEDLGPLSAKELQRLERQLEVALSQARQRKTQLMLEQIEELRNKERQLGEMNKQLKSKLEAGQGPFTTIQGTWDAGAIVGNNTFSVHPSQSTTMDCEPTTLQIGYHNFVSAEANLPRSSESNFNQGWIL